MRQSKVKEGSILAFMYEEAYRAHLGTSQVPEDRAASIVNDYSQELSDDLTKIEDEASKERYKQAYILKLRCWLSAKGRCMSVLVAGPANFPVARNEKANRSERNKYDEFRNWRDRAWKSINRSKAEKNELPPLEDVRNRLASRKDMQQKMKTANTIIRKGVDVESKLLEILASDIVKQILNPVRGYGKGFARFELTNNLAEIKRLEARLAELEKKEAAGVDGNKSQEFGAITLIENFEADRVQLVFPDKPDDKTRTLLKGNGFKWSPNAGAWQRKMTPQGVRIALQIAKHLQNAA